MIEDVELTRKILEIYAADGDFPSSISANSVCLELQDEYGRQEVTQHLVWAKDAGLLSGPVYSRIDVLSGPQYSLRRVDGLSKEGSDYVLYARSGLWDKAKNHIKKKSLPLVVR